MLEAMRIGPFVGGINTFSDASAIADNELVECVNFELDLDGSLVNRPAIVETAHDASWTERIVIIGRASLAGGNYVIGSNSQGTYAFNGTSWSTIKAGLQARVAVQYQDLVFIPAITGSAQDGGYWDGGVWTVDTNMPRGESAVTHKGRLFIAPGLTASSAAAHQLRYTDPINNVTPTPLVWTATNLIPVAQGDGQKLMEVKVYNDNLFLFKQDSSYVLAYDLRIEDGILRKINENIGVSNRHSVQTWQNLIYLLHEGIVYEVNNYDFQDISLKVPFIVDGAAPSTRAEETFLSLVGDRLVVRYFNNIYAFNLNTRTWSKWESADTLLHNFGPLVEFPTLSTSTKKYYSGSSILSAINCFSIIDGRDTSTMEATLANSVLMTCKITTKNFDINDPYQFKKLGWWGADVITQDIVTASANPVAVRFKVKWGQLSSYQWGQLKTWGQPLASLEQTVTSVDALNLASGRKFIKLLKAMRFRQINFKVSLISDGTTVRPARLFSLTAFMGPKQTVPKQVN